MSLILEALKKSEQQRRLGEAPTLGSPVLAVRGGRSLLPLFGILIVIAIATGWWLLRPAPGATPSAAPAPATTTPNVATDSAPMSRLKPTPPRPAERPTDAKPRTAKPMPSGLESVAPPLPIRPPLDDRPGSVTPFPLPAKTVAAAPAPAARIATPQHAPAAAAPPVEKPGATPAPTAAATPHPAPAPAAATVPLPLVWDLPYATRKDLPDLTLTMHMYAPDPHERFVVIKGERHIEGDDLGGGVILREIRPDGMVLDYKGTRFISPRGGG